MPAQRWAELHGWAVDRAIATPIARQIYMQVRSAILSGVLDPESRLPSTRTMATGLSVARASVVAAYEQLLAEGYVVCQAGSGTYVSPDLAGLTARTARRSRKPAMPPQPSLPTLSIEEFERVIAQPEGRPFNTGRTLIDAQTAEIWRRLTHQAVRSFGTHDLGYSDPRGFIELRQHICEYLRAARSLRCDPEQIVVTSGTQHAIDLAIRVLLKPGDGAWVEDPGYSLTHDQLHLAGVVVQPVPVDSQGIVIQSGRCLAPSARVVFVTPSHQFPTGVALSMARRLELLKWARASGAFIVEDDYTSEFRYSGAPLASLQGLDEDERVIYVGTLNKALFPGLRIGYAVVPKSLLPTFVNVRHLSDRQPPSLYQTVASNFMAQGHYTAHIRRTRQRYREQRDRLVETLTRRAGKHLEIEVPDQGMHLVAYIKDERSDLEIESLARQNGVIVRAVSRFYRSVAPRQGLILGFSGFTPQLIVPAATRLAVIMSKATANPRAIRILDAQPTNRNSRT